MNAEEEQSESLATNTFDLCVREAATASIRKGALANLTRTVAVTADRWQNLEGGLVERAISRRKET
jgi:hypothetical protein